MARSTSSRAVIAVLLTMFTITTSQTLDITPNHSILIFRPPTYTPQTSHTLYAHTISDLLPLPLPITNATPLPPIHLEAKKKRSPQDLSSNQDDDSEPTSAILASASASPSTNSASPANTDFAPGVSLVAILRMDSTPYTIALAPNGNLLFGTAATITPNAPAASVAGQTVSFGASGLIINGDATFPITAAAAPTGSAGGGNKGNVAAVAESGSSGKAKATVGPEGETLASEPDAASFKQFGAGNGTASGKGVSGVSSEGVAMGGQGAFGKSVFALLVGIFAMLLV